MNTYKVSSQNALAVNSSGGQLLKWQVDDIYIKTSTVNKQSLKLQFMYESYAEVIASRIGHKLGLDVLKYKLCEVIIDNKIKTIACESKDFKSGGYKEYSFGKLMQLGKLEFLGFNNTNDYNRLINNVQQVFKIDIKNYIDTIILFDALILNEDRHYGNFGLLINEKHNIKTIPIFDNGNSLFCHKHTDEMTYGEDLVNYLRCKPFDINCNKQLKLVSIATFRLDGLVDYIHRLLYEMRDKGLPEKREKFIKDLLLSRVNYLNNFYNIKN